MHFAWRQGLILSMQNALGFYVEKVSDQRQNNREHLPLWG